MVISAKEYLWSTEHVCMLLCVNVCVCVYKCLLFYIIEFIYEKCPIQFTCNMC